VGYAALNDAPVSLHCGLTQSISDSDGGKLSKGFANDTNIYWARRNRGCLSVVER
jgi:hypothetical protein